MHAVLKLYLDFMVFFLYLNLHYIVKEHFQLQSTSTWSRILFLVYYIHTHIYACQKMTLI